MLLLLDDSPSRTPHPIRAHRYGRRLSSLPERITTVPKCPLHTYNRLRKAHCHPGDQNEKDEVDQSQETYSTDEKRCVTFPYFECLKSISANRE